jgi:predicted Zn-dependent protease
MRHLQSRHIIILFTLLFFAPGCRVNPATGQKQLVVISEKQEIAMGRKAAGGLEKHFGGKVAGTELQEYVRSVGGKVAEVADRKMPYEFTLLASDVPNAFALPGGLVYVTAGLMKKMSNERQLAAVLGHEVGHVCALHNVHAMQRQWGAKVLLKLAQYAMKSEYASAAKTATEYSTRFLNLRYSRKDEYQADELGVRYMSRAGYNPYGMVELMEILLKQKNGNGSSFFELFQSHPLTRKRIERVREHISLDYHRHLPPKPDLRAERYLKMRLLLIATLKGEKL